MVFILSKNSNTSPQVLREVERAVNRQIILVPFRLEPVTPTSDLEYYLSVPHWLDAYEPPLEPHLERLTVTVRQLLGQETDSAIESHRGALSKKPPSDGMVDTANTERNREDPVDQSLTRPEAQAKGRELRKKEQTGEHPDLLPASPDDSPELSFSSKFCPQCSAEYDDDVDLCPRDGSTLRVRDLGKGLQLMSTAPALAARVMTEEPRPLTTVRRNVPPNASAAVSHALEKAPADRFASAHEFAEALNNPSYALPTKSAVVKANGDSRRFRPMFYGATALAVLMSAIATWGWMRPAPSKGVVRYNLVLDSAEAMAEGTSARPQLWGRLAISPDGSRMAYIGGPHAQLLVRPRNQLHATAMPGTEGASALFFSPDGQHIGFLTGKTLQLLSLNGGPPIIVTDTLVGRGGASWGRDGFIYASGSASLVRLEAKPGARPKLFTALDSARGEALHSWPDALPNGKGVLFVVAFNGKSTVRGGRPTFAIAVAEIPSGKHRVLINDVQYARYAASGHLLYVTGNRTLMVAPFDQNSMRLTGEPTALSEGVRQWGYGSADLAVSETGTLVYATGVGVGKQELVWVTRDGKEQSVDSDWQGFFGGPAISPDGKRLAVAMFPHPQTSEERDIWIKELDRGPSIKLTLEGSRNDNPGWTLDGRSVTFTSNMAGSLDLWTKRADGSARAVLQFHDKRDLFQPRWSPDGRWLVFQGNSATSGPDILSIRPGFDTAVVPLVATKFTEFSPAFSPDGRWLAYTSNESGQDEIYVVPFPNTGAAKWAVSTRGGTEPLWSHGGNELFYRDGAKNLVAVEVKTTPTFSLSRSIALFPAEQFYSFYLRPQYDVAPDDRRFLMIRPLATGTPDRLIVVENWFEELKATSRK